MKEYTLQDLRNLPTSEPPQYIIDGLLRTRRGRPSILGGFDHVGKSTLAQQMAKCVAKGDPFLGRETVQGKVLYFQTEESVEDAKIDFLKNMPDENEGIVVLHPDNPKNNFEELKAKLDKHPDTVFVIIETLMDFFGIRLREFWNLYMTLPIVTEQCMTWLDLYPEEVIQYGVKEAARKQALLRGQMTLDALI